MSAKHGCNRISTNADEVTAMAPASLSHPPLFDLIQAVQVRSNGSDLIIPFRWLFCKGAPPFSSNLTHSL